MSKAANTEKAASWAAFNSSPFSCAIHLRLAGHIFRCVSLGELLRKKIDEVHDFVALDLVVSQEILDALTRTITQSALFVSGFNTDSTRFAELEL